MYIFKDILNLLIFPLPDNETNFALKVKEHKNIYGFCHANCMKIGFLFFKILLFYVFKLEATGGHHFEVNIETDNY